MLAEGFVHGTDQPGALPGRYVVMLRQGHDPAAVAERIAGSDVRQVYAGGAGGFSAAMTAAEARRAAADPAVAIVEQDRVVRVTGAGDAETAAVHRNPVWGLDRVDERTLPLSRTYTPTSYAYRVRAYVIDTGIRITHTDFGGRARYGYDFVDNDPYAADCNGHGTHVAGTIGGNRYGVAKRAQLVAVRVLDCLGSGSLESILAGINWVTLHAVRPAVANMSLGFRGNVPSVNYAVNASMARGITYVLAAGNSNIDACGVSPASTTAAITVGATSITDTRAYFSNYGPCLDLFAPGVDITSAWWTSNTATNTIDGTSMAAPHVAGAAAMILAAVPSFSPAQVRNYMVGRSTSGRVAFAGPGSPNRLLYTSPPPARPKILNKATLRTAYRGKAYRVQLRITGSYRTGSWAVTSGRLPAGLRLTSTGAIIGRPTARTTRKFTVRFTDYVPQSGYKTFTLRVR